MQYIWKVLYVSASRVGNYPTMEVFCQIKIEEGEQGVTGELDTSS